MRSPRAGGRSLRGTEEFALGVAIVVAVLALLGGVATEAFGPDHSPLPTRALLLPKLAGVSPSNASNVAGAAPTAWHPPARFSPARVLILVRAAAADLGVPYPMNATVVGSISPTIGFLWTDTLGQTGTGAVFVLVAEVITNVSVTVTAFLSNGTGLSASSSVPVVGDPSVTLSAPGGTGDVGAPFPVDLHVAGGVDPFSLKWGIGSGALGNDSTKDSGGAFRVWVVPNATGTIVVTAQVEDFWGASDNATAGVGDAYPPLACSVSLSSPLAEVGLPLTAQLNVEGGAPPVTWSLSTSASAWNATPYSGVRNAGDPTAWSGTFETPSNVSLLLRASDASGSTSEGNASLTVLPALEVALLGSPPLAENGSATILGMVRGGAAPYTVIWSVSGTTLAQDRVTTEGNVAWIIPSAEVLDRIVAITVTDSLLVSSRASFVFVAGPPVAWPGNSTGASSAPASNSGALTGLSLGGIVLVALVASGVASVLWFRRSGRRKRSSQTPAHDPGALGVVHRLLESSPGLERETLEMMAQEEGVSTEAVAAAIDRGTKDGRIRVEEEEDGQAFLHWVSETAGVPNTASPARADP